MNWTRAFLPILLVIVGAAALSAKTMMRMTGYQTCGGGKIAADWAVYEVNANGVERLTGWIYEKCDGTQIWTPATASTQPLPDLSHAVEITTTPPPGLSEMQWGAFRGIRDVAVGYAVESGEMTELELMDDSEPNPGAGRHQQNVD